MLTNKFRAIALATATAIAISAVSRQGLDKLMREVTMLLRA
jgi:hypothetical protein